MGGWMGCSKYLDEQDMHDQPSDKTYAASSFFGDGLSARPVVAGTVARGQLHLDEAFYRGKIDGAFVNELPIEVDQKLLERGQQRFDIYCSVCHGRTGYGNGMIVERGFRRPPSYHIERLREAPLGYFFDVMTRGFGAMPSYAVQIEPRDRWAIVAYVRALQLSQNATLDDVAADRRGELERRRP
jgi:mono/diheme cytochrome c family protein